MKWYWAAILSFVLAATIFGTMYWTHPREVQVPYPVEVLGPSKPDTILIKKCTNLSSANRQLKVELKKWMDEKGLSDSKLQNANDELDSAYAWFYRFQEFALTDTFETSKLFEKKTKVGTLVSNVGIVGFCPVESVSNTLYIKGGEDRVFDQIYNEGVKAGKKQFNWATAGKVTVVLLAAYGVEQAAISVIKR